ncbi:MAG: PQQ-binding-like beta-propeller repeat protein [Bryobacterales bacterium]
MFCRAPLRSVSPFLPFCALALCLTGPVAGLLQAADWPSWRGVNGDGVSPEKGLPSSWSPDGENLLWKSDIGTRSTPIVLDNRVCVITLAEPEDKTKWQEQIACLNADTGEVVFDYRYNVYQTDIPHHRVGWASLAGDPETGNIYALGVEGMMLCLDAKGKVVWERSFEEQVGRISGFGGRTVTPIIDGDMVIVSFLSAGWGPNFIPRHRYYALDKATGETIWLSTPGGAPEDTTYSVPVVRIINGQRLLIDGNADGAVYALNIYSGEKVWGFPLSKRGLNSSIVVDGTMVYASHSEENVDGSTAMGRAVAIDAAQITEGKPKEIWRAEGFAAGYASPVIHDGIFYQVDNSANLAAFDAKTGEKLWVHNLGIAQRGSPLLADGKIYAADVDGKFQILKLQGRKEPEVMDIDQFKNPDSSAVQINGSPAIANGRIYLPTTNNMYAIGPKQPVKSAAAKSIVPPPQKAPAGAKPAYLQVIPAETNVFPGDKREFRVRALDEQRRVIGEVEAQWSVQGLKASISPTGELVMAGDNIPQGGTVVATVGDLKGTALVASRVKIPWKTDFSEIEEGKVPAGWPAAQGRFQTVAKDGDKAFFKPSGNPRSWRTTTYFGDPKAANYVIEADVKGSEARRRMPDIGLVSHRYTLALMGNSQELQIRSWLSELERFSKTIPYAWDPEVWYHVKLRVEPSASGSAMVRGKVWKKDEPEPAEWTIEAEDAIGHQHGSPGLYGFSVADIFYDNLSVTPQ